MRRLFPLRPFWLPPDFFLAMVLLTTHKISFDVFGIAQHERA